MEDIVYFSKREKNIGIVLRIGDDIKYFIIFIILIEFFCLQVNADDKKSVSEVFFSRNLNASVSENSDFSNDLSKDNDIKIDENKMIINTAEENHSKFKNKVIELKNKINNLKENSKYELLDIKNHWGENIIDIIFELGILEDFNGYFYPDKAISRADFVATLGKLDGCNVDEYKRHTFEDVLGNETYSKYIEWAYSSGIINGNGGGKFFPDRGITREELAVILNKYFKYIELDFESYMKHVNISKIPAFKDENLINPWAKESVHLMRTMGFMVGNQNEEFKPQKNVSRAEICVILGKYIYLLILAGDNIQ